MKVVFYGSLIHHLPPTLIAKVKTPWTIERFLEKDAKEDFARALADADRAGARRMFLVGPEEVAGGAAIERDLATLDRRRGGRQGPTA